MPCRVSSDVHEWNNEGPAVPAYSPVKPHNVDEQSTNLCRGEKTLWSFTAACCCGMVADAERSWEPSKPALRGRWRHRCNTSHSLPYRSPVLTGTAAGGQFGWGGTPLKKYRGGPKIGSGGTELRR
jgi:hypothetical protein